MKEVLLTRGQVALVDDEDFDRVNLHKWTASEHRGEFYAVRSVKRGGIWTQQYLHHFIVGQIRTDHRNGNKLDCQRENLRPATLSQNAQAFRAKSENTTSQFRGVTWDARNRKWRAKIGVAKKHLHLGRFSAEADAAIAYNKAAVAHFGEFASLNLI